LSFVTSTLSTAPWTSQSVVDVNHVLFHIETSVEQRPSRHPAMIVTQAPVVDRHSPVSKVFMASTISVSEATTGSTLNRS
jgi:hypothetical protein